MQDLLLVGSGGGKLPPTTRTIVSSSDDDEFMGLMLSNNMVHEMEDGFAFPLGDDIEIERGGW